MKIISEMQLWRRRLTGNASHCKTIFCERKETGDWLWAKKSEWARGWEPFKSRTHTDTDHCTLESGAMSEHGALNHGDVQDTLSLVRAANISASHLTHFVKFTKKLQIKLMLDLRWFSFVLLLLLVACNFPFAVNSVRHFLMAFFPAGCSRDLSFSLSPFFLVGCWIPFTIWNTTCHSGIYLHKTIHFIGIFLWIPHFFCQCTNG